MMMDKRTGGPRLHSSCKAICKEVEGRKKNWQVQKQPSKRYLYPILKRHLYLKNIYKVSVSSSWERGTVLKGLVAQTKRRNVESPATRTIMLYT